MDKLTDDSAKVPVSDADHADIERILSSEDWRLRIEDARRKREKVLTARGSGTGSQGDATAARKPPPWQVLSGLPRSERTAPGLIQPAGAVVAPDVRVFSAPLPFQPQTEYAAPDPGRADVSDPVTVRRTNAQSGGAQSAETLRPAAEAIVAAGADPLNGTAKGNAAKDAVAGADVLPEPSQSLPGLAVLPHLPLARPAPAVDSEGGTRSAARALVIRPATPSQTLPALMAAPAQSMPPLAPALQHRGTRDRTTGQARPVRRALLSGGIALGLAIGLGLALLPGGPLVLTSPAGGIDPVQPSVQPSVQPAQPSVQSAAQGSGGAGATDGASDSEIQIGDATGITVMTMDGQVAAGTLSAAPVSGDKGDGGQGDGGQGEGGQVEGGQAEGEPPRPAPGSSVTASAPAPSAPAPSVPVRSVQAPSAPAPSVQAPSAPAPSVQAPSVQAPSVQAPSGPVRSVPAPSVQAPSAPAPSGPVQSVPVQSASAATPGVIPAETETASQSDPAAVATETETAADASDVVGIASAAVAPATVAASPSAPGGPRSADAPGLPATSLEPSGKATDALIAPQVAAASTATASATPAPVVTVPSPTAPGVPTAPAAAAPPRVIKAEPLVASLPVAPALTADLGAAPAVPVIGTEGSGSPLAGIAALTSVSAPPAPTGLAVEAAASGARLATPPAGLAVPAEPPRIGTAQAQPAAPDQGESGPGDLAILAMDATPAGDGAAEHPAASVPSSAPRAEPADQVPLSLATATMPAPGPQPAASMRPELRPAPDDAAPLPAGAAFPQTISVFAPGTLDPAGLDDTVETIRADGFTVADARPVTYTIKQTHVRYYHIGDQAAAEALAASIGGEARDFTGFSPLPPDGTVELWLQGNTPKGAAKATTKRAASTVRTAPVVKAPSPQLNELLREDLHNRIVNQLRRGDHL